MVSSISKSDFSQCALMGSHYTCLIHILMKRTEVPSLTIIMIKLDDVNKAFNNVSCSLLVWEV